MGDKLQKPHLIQTAAHWWALQLLAPEDRPTGAPVAEFMKDWARDIVNPVTKEQAMNFQACLEDTILAFLKDKPWKVEDPEWGSYLRVFGCDWSPHPVLQDAAEEVGIGALAVRLPSKVNMWINPDGVLVAGYQERERERVEFTFRQVNWLG